MLLGMAGVGRNSPCPCGSGKKYKRCCWLSKDAPTSPQARPQVLHGAPREIPADVLAAFQQHQQREAARTQRYGDLRPPIATDFQGHKLVAVGSTLTWAKNWRTFHDFLVTYAAGIVGKEWGDAEIAKPFDERHPIAQWYHQFCEFQASHNAPNADGISEAVASGPVMAFLWVAYDLYTLEHHALLQAKLVERLKNGAQFQGARYELSVAAAFVRTGLDVTLEDEADTETSHCEFSATHKATGGTYSVEAKSRHRDGYLGRPGTPKPLAEINADVYALLQRALRKRAEHERVVFIDLNIPPDDRNLLEADWFKRVVEQMSRLQASQEGNPYPPAFLFFTNHPYHYVGNDAPEPGRRALLTAINIPAFQADSSTGSDTVQYLTQAHPAILALYHSVTTHVEIPHSFDWC